MASSSFSGMFLSSMPSSFVSPSFVFSQPSITTRFGKAQSNLPLKSKNIFNSESSSSSSSSSSNMGDVNSQTSISSSSSSSVSSLKDINNHIASSDLNHKNNSTRSLSSFHLGKLRSTSPTVVDSSSSFQASQSLSSISTTFLSSTREDEKIVTNESSEMEMEMKEENRKILTITNELKNVINENLWSATQSLQQLKQKFHNRPSSSSSSSSLSSHASASGSSSSDEGTRHNIARSFKKHRRFSQSQSPPKCLEEILKKMCDLWRANADHELNRFSKLSCHSHYVSNEKDYPNINWNDRIAMDIMRAGKIFVDGDIHEIFEFPKFKSSETRSDLVNTCIKYLQMAVCHILAQEIQELDKEATLILAEKIVKQAMISLCQDFVNDPYFRLLKEACNEWDLQPVDLGLKVKENESQEVGKIDSWTPRLVIEFHGKTIFTHVCRVFQLYEMQGVEAVETDFMIGFKRTYEINMFAKPPKILPPTFMSRHKDTCIMEITAPGEKADAELMQSNDPIGDFIPHSP